MIYIPRKIVYPLFIIVFSIVFFSIIFLFSFNQSLSVKDSTLEFAGEKLVFKTTITNISNHIIRNTEVSVKTKFDKKIIKLKDLNANEKFELITELPITENLEYEISIISPFNKTTKLFFVLDEETLRPATAEVQLAKQMVIGKKYDVVIRLCNVSKNDLFEVNWIENSDEKFFEEVFVPISTSLRVRECKNLYSSLTPIKTGYVKLNFVLKIGSLEQKYSQIVSIVGE